MAHVTHTLRLRRWGIDTHQEAVIYLRRDCPVCRSEGFAAQARVRVTTGDRCVIATLNIVNGELLAPGEAALSEAAWEHLDARGGDPATISHAPPVDSMSHVRAKVYGKTLSAEAMTAIVRDVVDGLYSDIHLAAFITACADDRLSPAEIISLTRAMVDAGERLTWPTALVLDKHCVGGLPGNRTSPLVVAMVTALGLVMPKTSSRSITSPAGTADSMETLAPVDLDLQQMRRVVEQEGGCLVWGGAVRLSPADDILIRVERSLDLDSEGQLIASVLSKKIAAGSSHVVIDMPVGPTAKVRSPAAAGALSSSLREVGKALGLEVRVLATDGSRPVGRGIGPALEAWDVLSVLQGEPNAPADLRAHAVLLAGQLVEMCGRAAEGEGAVLADAVLADGRAWRKFQAICAAQGGLREPPRAGFTQTVEAPCAGRITAVDNRLLSRVAKLAGAPKAKAAGLLLHTNVGSHVAAAQPLFSIHAETPGELAYALSYVQTHPGIFSIEGAKDTGITGTSGD
ncbi:MAG: thymidine phosphorylase [Armatimonadetes bacterium]|nr:thymidine phosphorylase [Armatimonadota bacterium]